MKITLEMNGIDDFEYLIRKFNLVKEFNKTIDVCIETGLVTDSREMIKDIRRHFIDNQFMDKINDIFGDVTMSLCLNE